MVDSFRNSILAGIVVVMGVTSSVSRADDPPAKDEQKAKEAAKKRGPLEDPPEPFVPLHPRTVEEQNRIEAVRLFSAARALEDKFQIGGALRGADFRKPIDDAVGLLEKASKLDPDSVAILRRLSKLSFVLGRNDQAVAYGKKILELDPGDTATLNLLVSHYIERKGDPVAAENLLLKVASNPKLNKTSAGYFLLHRNLGDLYADLLNNPEKAAEAYAKLMEALDERAASALPVSDQKRILQGDEAASYQKFGEIFLLAKRQDLAIRAFRKGLMYRADHPLIPRNLAEALLKAGKPAEAIEILDPYLKRLPSGGEPYELLVEILTALKTPEQIIPRLEEAAKLDPNNFRLQVLLADRYRSTGKAEKADAVLQALKANQTEPQLYAALAASYLKSRKAEELLKILGEALERPNGFEVVQAQVEALVKDPALVDLCLDAGLKFVSANPPELREKSWEVLRAVVTRANKPESNKLEKLLEIDRKYIVLAPTPLNYMEFEADLRIAEKFDEATATLEQFFAKNPDERNAKNLMELARIHSMNGKSDLALAAAQEAEKLEPNDPDTRFRLAFYLSLAGKYDEAVALYQALLKIMGADNTEAIIRIQASICNCYLSKGDNAKYESELEALFLKYPEDPGLNNDLGYYWADQGKNLERAEAMIRKALELQPGESSYLDSLGWVLHKRGKPKEAIDPLEKAYTSRADSTICEHLADVLFQLKDYSRAKDFYKKAEAYGMKTNPPDKRLGEIRKKLSDLEKLGPTPLPAAPGDAERP